MVQIGLKGRFETYSKLRLGSTWREKRISLSTEPLKTKVECRSISLENTSGGKWKEQGIDHDRGIKVIAINLSMKMNSRMMYDVKDIDWNRSYWKRTWNCRNKSFGWYSNHVTEK